MRVIFASGLTVEAHSALTEFGVVDRLVSYHYLISGRPEVLSELVLTGVPLRKTEVEETHDNSSPRRRRKWIAE